MKKLFFVLIAALTLTSVQSKAQTWGSVLTGNDGATWATALRSKAASSNFTAIPTSNNPTALPARAFQLVNGSTPYTTSYTLGSSTFTTYYYAFSWMNTRYYYSYTTFQIGSGSQTEYYYSYSPSAQTLKENVTNSVTGASFPSQNVPIDGGVSLLLGAGAVAHLKRKKLMSKFNNA